MGGKVIFLSKFHFLCENFVPNGIRHGHSRRRYGFQPRSLCCKSINLKPPRCEPPPRGLSNTRVSQCHRGCYIKNKFSGSVSNPSSSLVQLSPWLHVPGGAVPLVAGEGGGVRGGPPTVQRGEGDDGRGAGDVRRVRGRPPAPGAGGGRGGHPPCHPRRPRPTRPGPQQVTATDGVRSPPMSVQNSPPVSRLPSLPSPVWPGRGCGGGLERPERGPVSFVDTLPGIETSADAVASSAGPGACCIKEMFWAYTHPPPCGPGCGERVYYLCMLVPKSPEHPSVCFTKPLPYRLSTSLPSKSVQLQHETLKFSAWHLRIPVMAGFRPVCLC